MDRNHNKPSRPNGQPGRPGLPMGKPDRQQNNRTPRGNRPVNKQQRQGGGTPLTVQGATQSRGAAVRAQKRAQTDAQRIANQYMPAPDPPAGGQQRRANVITDDFNRLKITFLGGQDDIGEKNMQVIEWQNDAVVID